MYLCTYVLSLCIDARDEKICKCLILVTYVFYLCERSMLVCKRSMLKVYNKLPPILANLCQQKPMIERKVL